MARKVINPASTGTIKFATSSGGLASATAVSDQVIGFKLVPTANLKDIPATYGAGAAQSAAASSWAVQLSILQDWGKTASVSEFLWDHDGELVYFSHDPAGTTEGAMTGSCYAVSGGWGGAADENWVDDLTLPCDVKPTFTEAS